MLNMAWHSSYTIWVCAAVEICKILLVLHNILYECAQCGSMQLSSVLLLVIALAFQ
jgi:hypothetical protein